MAWVKKNWRKIVPALLLAAILFWAFLWPQTVAGTRILIRDYDRDREVTSLEHKRQLLNGFYQACTPERDCSIAKGGGYGAGGNPAVVIIRGNDLIGYTMEAYKVVGTDSELGVGYIGRQQNREWVGKFEVPLEEYEALRKLVRTMESTYPLMEQ